MAMPMPGGRLQIAGSRESGADVRTQNVTAVTAIANIVKTSLGPVGLDKVRRRGGITAARRAESARCVLRARSTARSTLSAAAALRAAGGGSLFCWGLLRPRRRSQLS